MGLTLVDPDFGQPGRINLLLGVEVFSEVVHQGWWYGVPRSPFVFETDFGWVLAGEASLVVTPSPLLAHHATAC